MKKKILVIEDERVTRTNILNFLDAEGFAAIGAENGRQGIKLAQEHLPELIICDILMPDLDGYDVLTQLQQEPKTAAIPFIFLTVSTDKDNVRRGMTMGADDYLSKPVTSAELRAAIASRIRRRENLLQTNFPQTGQIENLEQKILELERSINSKDELLGHLIQEIRQSLTSLSQEAERLQERSTDLERDHYLQRLQQEFARLLTLVNQVSELQQVLISRNFNHLHK